MHQAELGHMCSAFKMHQAQLGQLSNAHQIELGLYELHSDCVALSVISCLDFVCMEFIPPGGTCGG